MKHHNFLSVILALSMTAMLAIPPSYLTFAQESAPFANEGAEDTASSDQEEETSGENNAVIQQDSGDTQENSSGIDAADSAGSSGQSVHDEQITKTTEISSETVTINGVRSVITNELK